VNIDVDDLEKGIEFYCAALGFRLERRLFDDTAAEMAGASSPVYLLQKGAGTQPAATVETRRDYRRHWTPVHIDVTVDDLEGAVQKAQAAGARLDGPLQTHEWGRMACLSDPFGNGFCLLHITDPSYAPAPALPG
jgi:predicted enzyme related to lactoylglutathione lyase